MLFSCSVHHCLRHRGQVRAVVQLQVLMRSGTDTERKYATAIAPVRDSKPRFITVDVYMRAQLMGFWKSVI